VVFISQPSEVLPTLAAGGFSGYMTDRVGLPDLASIKRQYPNLPIMVYSGAEPPPELPPGVDRWAQKPLATQELKAVILNVIN